MPFYYTSHGKPAPNKFVIAARRIYRPLGFQRGYTFPLWLIFGFGSLIFCAGHARLLDHEGVYKDRNYITGDWEVMRHGMGKISFVTHLAAVIPIGILLPFQFLPVVRHKYMLWHRVAGHILTVLLLIGNVGAVMLADKAMGGPFDLRVVIYAVAGMSTVSLLLAWVNIMRLQIDQHRAWMLRAWFYSFIIVAQRYIHVAVVDWVTYHGPFYVPMSCHTIDFVLRLYEPGLAPTFYPECADQPDRVIPVLANRYPAPNEQGLLPLQEISASFRFTLAPTLLISFFLHAVGVEIYLNLTGHEAKRLRKISYRKQLAKGWSRPGNASWLTPEIWGDMGEESETTVEDHKSRANGKPLNGTPSKEEKSTDVVTDRTSLIDGKPIKSRNY